MGPASGRCRSRATSTRFSRPVSTSSTAANCPVRLIDSRTSAADVATSKPLTPAWPASARSSVARMRMTVVLPAPLEPSRAKMLPGSTSKSTPRSTCRSLNDFSRPCDPDGRDRCRAHRGLTGLRGLDRRGQPRPLLVDPAGAGVGLRERLGELHRVIADDLAHRGAVEGRALPQVGEVAEHQHEGVAAGDAAVVHEVPLEGLPRAARRAPGGPPCGPCPSCTASSARATRSGPRSTSRPSQLPPSRSCSIRAWRKLHVLQKSSSWARPLSLSV